MRVGSTPITLLVMSVGMSTSISTYIREFREYARVICFYSILLFTVRLCKGEEHACYFTCFHMSITFGLLSLPRTILAYTPALLYELDRGLTGHLPQIWHRTRELYLHRKQLMPRLQLYPMLARDP